MPPPPGCDAGDGPTAGEAVAGSDAWIADRYADLAPLAAALTDTTVGAAALIGATLVNAAGRGEGSRSAAVLARAQMTAVYLGRSSVATGPADGPLASLPQVQRVVWALREVEQLTQAEIASTLDRPPAAVGRALAGAYAALGPDDGITVLRRRTVPPPELREVRSAYHRALQHRSRRRWRLRRIVVLGVMVLTAVVAIPTVILPRLPVFIRPPGEWVFMHTVTPPQGWQVDSRTLYDDSEATFLSRTYGGAVPCRVFVSLVSTSAPAEPSGPTTRIRINGRTATYDTNDTSGARVTWWLGDRARVVVSCQPQTAQDLGDAGRANLVLIAESVRFGRTPITLPYTLTRVPERYAILAVTKTGDASSEVELQPTRPNPSDVRLIVRFRDGADTDSVVRPLTVPVAGRDAVLSRDADRPTLCFAPASATKPAAVCVAASWPSRRDGLSPVPFAVVALMTETAESLTFAGDPTDRRTWVDARTALPR